MCIRDSVYTDHIWLLIFRAGLGDLVLLVDWNCRISPIFASHKLSLLLVYSSSCLDVWYLGLVVLWMWYIVLSGGTSLFPTMSAIQSVSDVFKVNLSILKSIMAEYLRRMSQPIKLRNGKPVAIKNIIGIFTP